MYIKITSSSCLHCTLCWVEDGLQWVATGRRSCDPSEGGDTRHSQHWPGHWPGTRGRDRQWLTAASVLSWHQETGRVWCGAGRAEEREETTDTLRHCQPGERQDTPSPADWECEMWVLRPGWVRSRKIKSSSKKALIPRNRWETWSMRRFRVTWRSCPNTSELLKARTRE